MKVKFKEDQNYGWCLVVEYAEFIKGRDNVKEQESLYAAVSSYCTFRSLNYRFDPDEFKMIQSHLKPNCKVYFYQAVFEYPERRECFIDAIQDNEISKIRRLNSHGDAETYPHVVATIRREN